MQEASGKGLVKSGDILPLLMGGGDVPATPQNENQDPVSGLIVAVKPRMGGGSTLFHFRSYRVCTSPKPRLYNIWLAQAASRFFPLGRAHCQAEKKTNNTGKGGNFYREWLLSY